MQRGSIVSSGPTASLSEDVVKEFLTVWLPSNIRLVLVSNTKISR
jgi:hypothetical protein